MIVKNESKVIKRLLDSVQPLIDSYCICDTGSTDNTIEIIEAFSREYNIPGKIVQEPFQDFGYNRTFALNQCIYMGDADYLLLMDADMILKIDPMFSISQLKESMTGDAYHIFQGSDAFFYKNVRILKNKPGFSYWGVTHEYVQTPPDTKYVDIPKTGMFINDIGDGGSKSEKFVRDIRLLLKGLEENPDNVRYTFYLANSYRDDKQYHKAIETYKKRCKLGGWIEEVWHSYYSIGNCYKELDDMANAIFYWLEAYHYYPDRLENLYEIILYYRKAGHNTVAYSFYELADYERKRITSTDHLFLQKDIYDYKLDYELSIIGYYCDRKNINELIDVCMKVLSCKTADDTTMKTIISNYKFYTQGIADISNQTPSTMDRSNTLVLLDQIGDTISIDKTVFTSSTPSFCYRNNGSELVVNVRFVNYKINGEGEYINNANIITKNVVAIFDITHPTWKKTEEFELKYNTEHDRLYVGLEDVRLIEHNNIVYFNANRGMPLNGSMSIEHGIIDFSDKTAVSKILTIYNNNRVEKNWVMFWDGNGTHKMVYKWYPLTIGEIDDTIFCITHTIQTPPFFKWLRGSTNGIRIENETWFICHLVSYVRDHRYYYHIVVVLDSETHILKRYTRLFTFEKEKIEYALGFLYMKDEDKFMIGYSVMDRNTKYMMIPKRKIDQLMTQL